MAEINVTGTEYSAIPDVAEFIVDGVLKVPEGIEYILEESCHGREDLKEVYLPSSMKAIGPIAFAECPNLNKVEIEDGLEEIGDGAFLGAAQLTELKLPNSLKRIGPMAFYSSGLTILSIPESVEHIGENCFWECHELTRVDVLNPSCVIEEDVFGECPKLTQGYIAPGFPKDDIPSSNLIFSILWASEYEKHRTNLVEVKAEERRDFASMHIYMDDPRAKQSVSERAQIFIRRNQNLVLEYILRANNTAAMRGIIEYNLFSPEIIESGIKAAITGQQTELAALLLTAKSRVGAADDSFEL